MELVFGTVQSQGPPVAAGPSGDDHEAALGLTALLDEMAYGTAVCDLRGRLLHANQCAQLELRRARLIAVRDGGLHAVRANQADQLHAALARAGQGKRSLVTLKSSASSLILAVLPLRSPSCDPCAGPDRVALVFARAAVCDSLMMCFFARGHGLTLTEEQVLTSLCQGHSAPEVASQMGVAVSTVRSHVRNLCAKTRAKGVRDLVNQVAVLPPVTPPPLSLPIH